jgi:hypothetical protein
MSEEEAQEVLGLLPEDSKIRLRIERVLRESRDR